MRRDAPSLQRTFIFLAVVLAAPAAAQEVTLVAGGDVEWSRATKPPDVFLDPEEQEEGGWLPVPYVNAPRQRAHLEGLGRILETPESHHVRAIHYGLEFEDPAEMARYPFEGIGPVFREADVAFVNLETPLSDRARWRGAFRTPTAFVGGLRWAGIDVVSTANNHALDAEGEGLRDTREALWRAGIGAVGTGRDLAEARRPFVVERSGLRIAFLAYAAFVNGGPSGFALHDRAGVAPMDPILVEEDVRRVRDQVDLVVVSFHWNIENSQETHADARAFAHRVVDSGADLILGHHPHVPRGVEIYRERPIFYSLGNLIFGHNHTYWMDNTLARLTLTPEGVSRVEVLPVAGRGNELSRPRLLEGAEARALLEDIRARSAALDTPLEIVGDVGVVRIR
ncbi:MAG: CapA family protein [Gemmatimonadetes bacterium]|nr:CapA family protein [Gemmatimonadota bacterium]NIR78865.1 CapA family protein [Gemmatimonadota bacterium]NIT87504.1 CapA family protein [Gemmatimonadota bacterium]NIU31373.1 CapA family protein [Gemmatimonadota bacterium]NIU36050.1 CapA family protein [Gemmatimonadota bacterium]